MRVRHEEVAATDPIRGGHEEVSAPTGKQGEERRRQACYSRLDQTVGHDLLGMFGH